MPVKGDDCFIRHIEHRCERIDRSVYGRPGRLQFSLRNVHESRDGIGHEPVAVPVGCGQLVIDRQRCTVRRQQRRTWGE